MIHLSHKMTPLMPTVGEDLNDIVLEIYRKSASLGGQLHPTTRRGLVEFLRLTNSYYSNLVEGHYTRPIDIERAILDDFAHDPIIRSRQMEARVHIEVQQIIEALIENSQIRVCSSGFIRLIHRFFYERLSEDFWIVRNEETGFLLREAFLVGEFARGEAARITGLGERTARQVLRLLTDEGLLVSDSPKTPVRLVFSAATAPYWLPDLISR
jgi:Fic family protein